ncbi:MAG: peptidase M14, partial [Lentisphaeria bacterium]|nr:peptidase M14 [Lentisphaeria bacterium]
MSFVIDSDFAGGNIVVENVDGDEVRLHQDLRDTARDWFYWCFRVRGAEGRTLRFLFTTSRAL